VYSARFGLREVYFSERASDLTFFSGFDAPLTVNVMATRRRNKYLEGDESEDEGENGYASEEEGRGAIGGRASKRQRLDIEDEESEDDFHNFEDMIDDSAVSRSRNLNDEKKRATGHDAENFALGSNFDDGGDQTSDHGQDELSYDADKTSTTPKPSKPPKSVVAAEKAARKSGVLYISRVPPFMKPATLRHFLAPHAPKYGLGRLFLAPEDPTAHRSRVRRGGNKKKSYVDGWVEFGSKKEARIAAETLNGCTMGGRKGGWYYDDVWSVRYLRGFKWSHLTEQIAQEDAERAARMREEVRRTRRENQRFVEDVERGKMLAGMERKRKAKGKEGVEGMGMVFKQRKVREEKRVEDMEEGNSELRKVLGKIF